MKTVPTYVGLDAGLACRKSSQEVEIDHLLAEEFVCDPSFADRFIAASGLSCLDFRVTAAIAEPSLGGEGFGDLLVEGTAKGMRVVLLIEDKITAGPAFRQAERYAAHARNLCRQGWDQVWTVLVAPGSYRGERSGFDASVDLENVVAILRSPDPLRLSFRRGIIERALIKRVTTGVRVPDARLHELKAAYLTAASEWRAAEGVDLDFPVLRESYYDGDSWIEPVRNAGFPGNVRLRHRFWTSTKDACGRVDLIVSPATELERETLSECRLEAVSIDPYSDGKGLQLSVQIPELRQRSGFDPVIALEAFQAMKMLTDWFLENAARK